MAGKRSDVREARIIDAFVDLADSLVDGYDPLDFLYRLLDHGLPLVDADAGGVVLHVHGRLHLVAASNGASQDVAVLELHHDQGPVLDAFGSGETVSVDRFSDAIDRWPAFASAAAAAGWVSAVAIPLRLRDTIVGALVVFWPTELPIDDAQRTLLRGFADVATIAVLQQQALTDAELLNEQLHTALEGRLKVEQAKGMIAERTGTDLGDALAALRRHARSTNRRLKDVAADVIDRNLDIASFA